MTTRGVKSAGPPPVDGDAGRARVERVSPEQVAAAGVRVVSVDGLSELLIVEPGHADRRDLQTGDALEDRMVVDGLPGDVEVGQVGSVELEGAVVRRH